jgi:hypothetical protein
MDDSDEPDSLLVLADLLRNKLCSDCNEPACRITASSYYCHSCYFRRKADKAGIGKRFLEHKKMATRTCSSPFSLLEELQSAVDYPFPDDDWLHWRSKNRNRILILKSRVLRWLAASRIEVRTITLQYRIFSRVLIRIRVISTRGKCFVFGFNTRNRIVQAISPSPESNHVSRKLYLRKNPSNAVVR